MIPNFKECPLVVSSCDAYSDIWPAFFKLLFKYWPEIAHNVYLIANHKSYPDERVKSICVGKDKAWGSNMLKAFPEIDAEIFIYFQDDYLLNQAVDVPYLWKWIELFQEKQGKYLGLRQFKFNQEKLGEGSFLEIPKDSFESWVPDFNVSVWRKPMLQQLAELKKDVWQTESEIRKLRHTNVEGFYYIIDSEKPFVSYLEGVKGKFWMPKAVAFCKAEGIELDLKTRPCPPQGQDPLSKLIRSYYKRKMKLKQTLKE